jgi:hypothetical protein
MLPAFFGNVATGTCPECATCLTGTSCCSSINNCFADNGCNALILCQFNCNNNSTLPGDAAVPDGGDCMALCASAVDAGAVSQALFTAEDNCWEGTGPGATTCGNACMCNGTPGDGGSGDDGGGDATTPPSDAAADAGGGD